MAQLALLSHVALLKQKELEKETPKEPDAKGAADKKGRRRLNKDNAEAYNLIASGILG